MLPASSCVIRDGAGLEQNGEQSAAWPVRGRSEHAGWDARGRFATRCADGTTAGYLTWTKPSRAQRLVDTDPATAAEILDAAEQVPVFTWGRDKLDCGDMWNSNSLTSWLLATAGIDMTTVNPPHGGRAPGWHAGLVLAARESATDERTLGHVR